MNTTQIGAIGTLLLFQLNIKNRLTLTEFAVFKWCIMRESRKFCQRGSNFDNFFLVDEGRKDPNTISGRSTAHLKWRFAGVPMMAQH